VDIKSIKPTAKVTYELDGKDASVTFEVAFVAPDMFGDYGFGKSADAKPPKFSALVRSVLMDAVQGWDLTEDGKAISCTDANKAQYLPVIFGLLIKDEQANPLDRVLGRALLTFAMDSDNFLKN